MASVPATRPRPGWRNRLLSSPKFQAWAARFPLTRRRVRREGEVLFDLVAGFCHSQVLRALVELEVLELLAHKPLDVARLSALTGVPVERMEVLARAATQLGLIRLKRGSYRVTQRGAALTGVPGLAEMIQHHDILYRDLADPVAFFRGETDPELAHFWPYVFGEAGGTEVSERYSQLMSDSLGIVAEETFSTVSLKGVEHMMDVGGGTGAFITHAAKHSRRAKFTLFDLPPVVPSAEDRFKRAGLTDRVTISPGSFRDDPLPTQADTISLIRVLYDHNDETVGALLSKIYNALPNGGQLIVSEPMAGSRAGDAYFALYTMAMGTGQARTQVRIAELCAQVGFDQISTPKSRRPFVTSVVLAKKPT